MGMGLHAMVAKTGVCYVLLQPGIHVWGKFSVAIESLVILYYIT